MTTQLNIPFFALKAGLYVLFVSVLLTSACILPAVAQPTPNSEARAGEAATVSELAPMLTAPGAAARDEALHLVTDLARRSPEVDLAPLIPLLTEMYVNDPDAKYRLAAVSALHAIGDETGMEQVRERFVDEPSLIVQYVSVCALIDLYGPKAFGRNKEALSLARNVLARKHEALRLADLRYLKMVPRVLVGPLEVVHPDSLQ